MAQIFPKWVDEAPKRILIGSIILLNAIVFGIWYFFSPEFTDVGYMPEQPVPFSHQVHVAQLGMDCQYCHTQVEESRHANIPATQTCMNCHSQIRTDAETLQPVRDSWETGEPIEWVRVHMLPDYAYSSHQHTINMSFYLSFQ